MALHKGSDGGVDVFGVLDGLQSGGLQAEWEGRKLTWRIMGLSK